MQVLKPDSRGHRPPRRVGWAVPVGWVALLLVGCSTPPPARWHSLLPPAPATAVTAGAGRVALPTVGIALAPVRVPLQVDQPQWLVRRPDQSLVLLENERWASPLRDELRAALRDRLAHHWAVFEAPAAPWRVELELLRFESVPGQLAWLEAHWSITPVRAGNAAPAAPISCRATLREPVGDGALALADGHRRAVQRLADLLGQQLRGAGSDCPPAAGAVSRVTGPDRRLAAAARRADAA